MCPILPDASRYGGFSHSEQNPLRGRVVGPRNASGDGYCDAESEGPCPLGSFYEKRDS